MTLHYLNIAAPFHWWYFVFWPVCNAGFYKNDAMCMTCPANRVKNSPGNATECDISSTCNGESSTLESTACGKIVAIEN